jgi:hypothetical protein
MLREPAFARGEFHTGYLDELLQIPAREPFDPPDVSSVEVAALAPRAPRGGVQRRAPAANPVGRGGATFPARRSGVAGGRSARREGLRA